MGYGGRGFKPPLSLHQFFLLDIAILSLFMTFSHYYRHIANITSMGVFESRENRNLNCVERLDFVEKWSAVFFSQPLFLMARYHYPFLRVQQLYPF